MAFSALLIAATTAFAAPSKERIDQTFNDVVQRYHLPGLAVGVIDGGKIIYTRTSGEREAGSGKKITRQTLFKIASNSKAMTASLLARLVDAGKLRWDDPVIKYLPDFRMFAPWVTQNMQVRDLLVHNSGLPEGGGDLMLWPEPNQFARADILAGLGHIKPKYSFRAGYAYDNLLYVVAGEVAAAAGGASYEELMRTEVFAPLGLNCRVGAWKAAASDDIAQPHGHDQGRNIVVGADGEAVAEITSAAAGGIRCSLDDMLRWAGNWLTPDAKQRAWLSAAQRAAMWAPHTPMPISARRRAWDHTHAWLYAFGFRVGDVDGEWTVSHTGTLSGMYSMMMLLPDRKSGFVILINGEAGEARTVLGEALVKQFTAPDDPRSVSDYAADLAADRSSVPGHVAADAQPRKPVTPVQLNGLLGLWRDPWFGDVTICAEKQRVRFRSAKSPRLLGTLMRTGERILVDWDDDSVDAEAWLDFSTGEMPSLRMSKVDPEADFSFDYEDLAFTRVGDCD
ncbi:MAG TPA: serine hydrolase [Dokdonella sp.]|uniref:serine hydrolase n=1 Tax=Dokdonella sp. TaxID=2291710 RepID=UPI002D7F336A|nr:serine hydrolase [Dokdonella sp.]HET9032491.1 serine hydrolase [Dokdonella sp.]